MNFVLAIMIIIIGCRILDDTPLHSIRVNLTQEEKEQLEVEGQCFLACAIRVYNINEVIRQNVCLYYLYQATLVYHYFQLIWHWLVPSHCNINS